MGHEYRVRQQCDRYQHGVRKLRSYKWDTSTESDNNVTDINMESGSSGAGNGTRVQSQTTM